MADIHIGSQVNNPDGSIAKVINEIPRGVMPIYELTFIDGAKTRVSDDHLWLIRLTCETIKADRRYDPYSDDDQVKGRIWTTQQIYDFMEKKKVAPDNASIKNQNLLIPLSEPVKFTKSYRVNMRPVHPYVLGALLGDGCITGTNTPSFTSEDQEVIDRVNGNLGDAYLKRIPSSKYVYSIREATGLIGHLKKLKVYGHTAKTKFIPESYKNASIEQRIELIRGLMDTDGTVDDRGHVSFTSISRQLAEDVQWVIRSLGGKATMSQNRAGYKKNGEYIRCNDAYIVYIRTKYDAELFSLQRKIDRCREEYNGGASILQRRLVNIEYIGEEEAKCITVDHPNGLYLCEGFIVTHNSKSFSLSWDAAFHVREDHWEYKGKTITEKVARDIQKLPPRKQKGLNYVVDKVSVDYPEYQALLVRRTYPQLLRNIKPETDKLYAPYGAKWSERDKCYKFPSGAKIYLVHCADIRALDNYIGGNFHYIGIDEANTFPEDWVDRILSSARSTNPKIKVLRRLTANPGNIGHSWLKKKYVERCKPIYDGPKKYNKEYDVYYQPKISNKAYVDDGLTYKFIPSSIFDNPSILDNDPAYVKFLKGLPDLLRSMWLDGEWDTFAGQYFDNWNPYYHVIPQEEFMYGKNWSKVEYTLYRGYDEGTKSPFVSVLAAVSSQGDVIIFDEIYETGLAASAQAKMVNDETMARYGLTPDDFDEEIADPAYWTKKSEKEGQLYSPADFYEDEGIFLTPGNNDRKAGAKLFYQALSLPEGIDDVVSNSDQWNTSDIHPKLRFTDNCTYAIESIPNLPAREDDPEDIDTKTDDHIYDSVRYLIMKLLAYAEPSPKEKKGWRDRMSGNNFDRRPLDIGSVQSAFLGIDEESTSGSWKSK